MKREPTIRRRPWQTHWLSIVIFSLVAIAGMSLAALAIDWPVGSGKTNCLDCHMTHNALGGRLINATTINNLCNSCHASGPGPVVTTHQGFSCTTCHEPHNQQGSNLFHIRTTVATTLQGSVSVTFADNSTPGSADFAQGSPNYNGICEVCHSTTSYHRFDGSGVAHSSGAGPGGVCTQCHDHADDFAGAGGGCTDCHNTTRGSGAHADGTLRRIVVGASGDFDGAQLGGHMTGQSPTNYECVICHKEGYVDGSNNVVVDSIYHNNSALTAPYPIDLRNVDDASASFTVYNNPNGPAGKSWDATSANNMTEFCLRCHDSDGAQVHFTQRVGAGGSTGDPFGDKGGAPLDTLSQFLTSNFASHAINSSRGGLGAKYTADFPTDPNGIKSAAFVSGWGSASTTECSDCHLGQENAGTPTYYRNAHGGQGLPWLMKDKNGLDLAFSRGSSMEPSDSTITCYACHDGVVYSTSESGGGSSSRYEKHGQNGHADPTSNTFDIGCMNCHGGWEAGGIHGTNLVQTDDGNLGSYNSLRFTNGAALDYWGGPGGSITCSSFKGKLPNGNNIGCNQHRTQSYTANY